MPKAQSRALRTLRSLVCLFRSLSIGPKVESDYTPTAATRRRLSAPVDDALL